MDQSPSSPLHKKPPLENFGGGGGKTKAFFGMVCAKKKKDSRGVPMICEKEYNICIVDLLGYDYDGVDDSSRSPPYIRINCGDNVAEMDGFCVLGNTLYMFEGCVDGPTPHQFPTKAIYSIDISPVLNPPVSHSDALPLVTFKKSELPKAGEMSFPKRSPTAIAVPGGQKILVFSTIHFNLDFNNIYGYEPCDAVGGFELFDTAKGSSVPLPPIKYETSPYIISSHGLLDDSKFVVLLLWSYFPGLYVVDFDALDKGWVKLNILCGVESWKFPRTGLFEIVQGRFCVGYVYGFHDLQDPEKEEEECPPPFSLFFMTETGFCIGSKDGFADYLVTYLDHNERTGECCFCELRVERFAGKQSFVRFQFDVGIAHLNCYIQDVELHISKPRLDYAKGVKSLQFGIHLGEFDLYNHRIFFTF